MAREWYDRNVAGRVERNMNNNENHNFEGSAGRATRDFKMMPYIRMREAGGLSCLRAISRQVPGGEVCVTTLDGLHRSRFQRDCGITPTREVFRQRIAEEWSTVGLGSLAPFEETNAGSPLDK